MSKSKSVSWVLSRPPMTSMGRRRHISEAGDRENDILQARTGSDTVSVPSGAG